MRDLLLGHDGFAAEHEVAISSTKGAIGHLLGAAGAVEAVFSVLAVAEVRGCFYSSFIFLSFLPPTDANVRMEPAPGLRAADAQPQLARRRDRL